VIFLLACRLQPLAILIDFIVSDRTVGMSESGTPPNLFGSITAGFDLMMTL
jgi:hypothetical protein